MRQHLLSVHYVAGSAPPSPEAMQQAYDDVAAFNGELQGAGAWVFAGGLQPPDEATVVRPGTERSWPPKARSPRARSISGASG